MKNGPLVSIIIPTYNRADKVGDAIESALNQSYDNVEVLVVDDGSVDVTEQTVLGFPSVRYIKQSHAGQAAARNNGLKHSSGTIIANLDSDDLWDSNFIEYCVEKLEADQLDFVFANWTQQSKTGSDWDFMKNDIFLAPYLNRLSDTWVHLENCDLRDLYLQACPSPSSSLVMRKTSIANGWDETIQIGDDWALYLDMILSKQCRAAFTIKKLWRKRIDNKNIYDGRSRSEVLNLLYNSDISRFIDRHHESLSKCELRKLTKLRTYGLIELSKHKVLRELNFKASAKLMIEACSINILFSIKAIPIIFFRGLANKVNFSKFPESKNDDDRNRKTASEAVI